MREANFPQKNYDVLLDRIAGVVDMRVYEVDGLCLLAIAAVS